MGEIGLDISGKQTQDVFDVYRSGQFITYTITVCSEGERAARACPIFPGITEALYWSFPDPSAFTGTREEKLQETREVRNQIAAKIEEFCAEICQPAGSLAKPCRGQG